MKIQILFPLTAVGLAFAKPIHNLGERNPTEDTLTCVRDGVEAEFQRACENAVDTCRDGLYELSELRSCIDTATTEAAESSPLRIPIRFLTGYKSCLDRAPKLGNLQSEQLQILQEVIPQIENNVLPGCIKGFNLN
ncbi:hypothetical protein BDV38DRAFT_286615 [Aspergillus pseudotamarii]|uniref:Uncharacterized protein n=1 Tax=Aspergillus pseudotamarii TaxID=132259 RepID=A0A5N6SII2_ASPPS|nr:uncharacterized protein BDV38DRAFT_286615 [Aspergillus pseudotamarii]KAE8133717.1 hypothetical protein BDV38DRAFT_286615 [Aspergillus pseudotamarii]